MIMMEMIKTGPNEFASFNIRQAQVVYRKNDRQSWSNSVLYWYEVKLMSKDLPVDILLNTGCYLVVLGQYRAVLVGTWWFKVRTGWCSLPVWYALENVWFTWYKPSKYLLIFEEGKVLIDNQINKQDHLWWI